ncbi:hypothetical protein TNCV_1075611 [Trichonephila clavipes]|uniref:Uncharacterized protein n=1 Tax=Trichonephila clavipes TaxID=2585209 RepID=A0A8X6T0S7_TRICX|nr:hypothetical protein TNCV_1075611 [Trichonephila clavipes]
MKFCLPDKDGKNYFLHRIVTGNENGFTELTQRNHGEYVDELQQLNIHGEKTYVGYLVRSAFRRVYEFLIPNEIANYWGSQPI